MANAQADCSHTYSDDVKQMCVENLPSCLRPWHVLNKHRSTNIAIGILLQIPYGLLKNSATGRLVCNDLKACQHLLELLHAYCAAAIDVEEREGSVENCGFLLMKGRVVLDDLQVRAVTMRASVSGQHSTIWNTVEAQVERERVLASKQRLYAIANLAFEL